MSKLGEIFLITSGGTPNRKKIEYYQNGTIPWVKTGDLKDKYVSKQIEYITELGLQNSSAKLFPSNTVLLAMYGATIGACSILPFECATNQACAAFLPSKKVLPEYLYYFLLSHQEKFIRDGVGGAQPNISAGYLKNVDFELLSLEKQKQIAENLDKVTHLIDLCNQMLDKLDLLVKSRFIELFGDPVLNSKKWEVKRLQDITNKIGSGATPKGGRESYGTEGISLIRSMNVYNGYFEHKELAHISDEQAKKLDNVIVQKNDVLLNITGASVARCCLVPSVVLPARVNQHVCIIRCESEVLPLFVCSVLTDGNYQKHLWKIAGSGATREAITKQQVENLEIILPPLELQTQFSEFVQTVDKSKLAVKQLLEKAETLKKSLMQEYFSPQKGAFPHES